MTVDIDRKSTRAEQFGDSLCLPSKSPFAAEENALAVALHVADDVVRCIFSAELGLERKQNQPFVITTTVNVSGMVSSTRLGSERLVKDS